MKSAKITGVITAALFIILTSVGFSQDTHYWNIQYGTRSTLLGGAVIGSVQDFAATYYNPGAIALFANPEFIISAKVYEWTTMTLKNGAGENRDLSSSSIKPAPSLLAGSFTFNWAKKHKFAYSILTRQKMNFGFETRNGDTVDVIPSSPGKENFGGEVIGEQDLSDIWVGLTWSTLLSSKVGFGITQFVSARSQNTRLQIIAHALKSDTTLASTVLLRQLKYTNFRLLWKAGIGINLNPLTLGFSVTTPSLDLFGSGFSLYDDAVNGLGQDYWAANFQDGLASKYKSSWAFGGGASYRINNIRLHLSAEWFDAVKEFDVLATEDFKAQSADTIISPRVSAELKSVINWGAGLEVLFNKKVSGYGSFVTDYSAAVPGTQSVTTISNWDIFHISAGTLLKIGKTDLTLGATYAFGSNDFERLADFSSPGEDDGLEQPNRDAKFKYSRLKFIFGFSFQF